MIIKTSAYNRIAQDGMKRAIQQAGGLSELSRQLEKQGYKITRQGIFRWHRVPLKYVPAVARISGVSPAVLVPETALDHSESL